MLTGGLAGLGGLLGEELEGALLGLVTGLHKTRVGLLASSGLLAAHDAATLVEDKILAGKTAAGVAGSAMEDLGFGTNGKFSRHVFYRGIRFL